MTIEEAIGRIKDHMCRHGIGKYPHIHIADALEMAISALREQEERAAPCMHCDGSETPFPVFSDVPYASYNRIVFEDGHALMNDADGNDILIKACPMCGRELKEGVPL